MFFGETRTKELIPCIICAKRFSVEDVAEGQYFISTSICMGCYDAMQKQPYSESCFGKPNIKQNGLVLYGFSTKSLVCMNICPDREICKMLIEQKRERKRLAESLQVVHA